MNSQTPQLRRSHATPKRNACRTVRIALAAAIGLACAAINPARAQVSTINSVILQPQVLHSLTNAVLSVSNDYPTLISFVETNAGTANTAFSPDQDLWQFSVNGGSNAYVFSGSDAFTASMTVTLAGAPLSPRKEAGFAFNDVDGNINGQFILDLDAGEVVAFGGNLPFYATALDHFYLSGEPITMGITIFTDSNGKQAIIYTADGFSSEPLEFGSPQTNYTLGGYFQIQGQGTSVTNHGSATFSNITITALPNGLGIAGTQIAQAVSITGSELAQGAETDKKGTTTTATPKKTPITTASILAELAQDENTAGKYSETTFPAGSKLWYTADSGFEVVSKTGAVLVNVGNILSLQTAGQNDITSGVFEDSKGATTPPFNSTQFQLVTVTYDAAAVGGTTKFSVTGLGTSTTTTTTPSSKGRYTESDSFNLQNGTGEGVNSEGAKIIVTGVIITASGSSSL